MICLLANTCGDALLNKWHFTGMMSFLSFYLNQIVETGQHKHIDSQTGFIFIKFQTQYYTLANRVNVVLEAPRFALNFRFHLSFLFPYVLGFVDIFLVKGTNRIIYHKIAINITQE